MSSDAGQEPATEALRQRLKDLHKALLNLHKTLLNIERQDYERINGRVTSGQLLHLVINDGQFAWLRPISAFIVRIDELLEAQEPEATTKEAQNLIAEAKYLLYASENGNEFERKFNALLQRDPSAVLAQKEVSAVLSPKNEPS